MTTKRILKTLATMAVMVCLAALPAIAQSELDQSQAVIDTGWSSNEPDRQTFTAQKTGTLDKVSVWVGCMPSEDPNWFMPCDNGTPTVALEIKGTQSDPPAQQFPVSPGAQWYEVSLDPAPFVEAGKQYEIWLSTSLGFDARSSVSWGGARSDVYPGGEFSYYDLAFNQWTTRNDIRDLAFQTYVTPDTTAPKVDSVSPAAGAKGVTRDTTLTAHFSEKMDASTLTAATFKLFKVNSDGTTRRVTNALVTPSEDGLSVTLDPYGSSSTLLARNTRYKAVLTTGAKDLAGNALDQNATTTGNQQKTWYFTTGRN